MLNEPSAQGCEFIDKVLASNRKPDFSQLLRVLEGQTPERPTLFEFFLNERLHVRLSDMPLRPNEPPMDHWFRVMKAYRKAGYDYVTLPASSFTFPNERRSSGTAHSISLNEGACIQDASTFHAYPWPDPDLTRTDLLSDLLPHLPEGMKAVVYAPGGLLENVTSLVGFENLCYLMVDEPSLVAALFDAVGSRLTRYYELAAAQDGVGACIVNDDWGFKTQTMISMADMRRNVFPWHKRMVHAIHEAGKPAILHSCGQLEGAMEEIIEDMGYDAKHSFEDSILPIESSYLRYGGRIALLGGIDVDFLCRSTPQEILDRSRRLLRDTSGSGFALGSGNSIPPYVPDEHWAAMVWAALEG